MNAGTTGWITSDGAYALGLRPLLTLADLELDPLALIEGLEARALDLRVMHEDVRAAPVLSDEAEALLAVEPLHTALRHADISLRLASAESSRRGPPVTIGHPCTARRPWEFQPASEVARIPRNS